MAGSERRMVRMTVLGVRVHVPLGEVVVLLAEESGDRVVPISIGPREGAAIAAVQAGLVPPRPQTHDLMLDVVKALGSDVMDARVVGLRDGTFFAEVELSGGVVVDSRASDAIALALRAGAPVRCAEEVVEAAGVVPDDNDVDLVDPGLDEGALAQFRAFLESVEPDDFADEDS